MMRAVASRSRRLVVVAAGVVLKLRFWFYAQTEGPPITSNMLAARVTGHARTSGASTRLPSSMRELLESREGERGGPLILTGAADALTARLIEELGFKAVYLTGAGVTNRHLGIPDLGLITLTELADPRGGDSECGRNTDRGRR
jgi:hypothetical protein